MTQQRLIANSLPYSILKFFTGFIMAAFSACAPTVANAMINASIPATTNTQKLICTRLAKYSSLVRYYADDQPQFSINGILSGMDEHERTKPRQGLLDQSSSL